MSDRAVALRHIDERRLGSASEDQEVRTSLEVWPHGLGRARVVVLHLIGGMSYRDRLSTAPTASSYEAKCFTDETGRSAVLA